MQLDAQPGKQSWPQRIIRSSAILCRLLAFVHLTLVRHLLARRFQWPNPADDVTEQLLAGQK